MRHLTPPQRCSDGAPSEQFIDGVRIERGVRGLRITRPWAKAAGYAMLLWVAVWFGVVSFFTSLGSHRDIAPMLLLALPGIGMAYAAMTRLFNKTVIEVTRNVITVCHSPLPWPGRRRFMVPDVKSLHVKVKKIYAKAGPHDECWIMVARANGKKSVLLKGLEMSALQMSGIAAAISGYLGVPVYAE